MFKGWILLLGFQLFISSPMNAEIWSCLATYKYQASDFDPSDPIWYESTTVGDASTLSGAKQGARNWMKTGGVCEDRICVLDESSWECSSSPGTPIDINGPVALGLQSEFKCWILERTSLSVHNSNKKSCEDYRCKNICPTGTTYSVISSFETDAVDPYMGKSTNLCQCSASSNNPLGPWQCLYQLAQAHGSRPERNFRFRGDSEGEASLRALTECKPHERPSVTVGNSGRWCFKSRCDRLDLD